jgi:hypothetical protein
MEPITASVLVVAAAIVWMTGANPLLGAGIFLGALLRFALPLPKYIAATLMLAPVLFAIDRYNAPIVYEVLGYRQIFGAGAGIYIAMLGTGLLGPPRMRLWATDVALGAMFLLLAASTTFADADMQAAAMFGANTLPLIAAYFAARRMGHEGTDLVLDAIVMAAIAAVLGRWIDEGPGVSAETYRAGTNWYLGPAVYGGLPLLLAWALVVPVIFRVKTAAGRLRTIGRYVALALLSAELVFLQVKTVFVVLAICAFAFMRLSRQKERDTPVGSPLSLQRMFLWVFMLLMATFVYSVLNERIGTLYSSFWGNESDQLRLNSMLEHVRMVLDRPFGYGFSGLFETALPQTAQTSHNTFIDIAGDASFIAAFAFAFAFVSTAYLIVKRGRDLVPQTPEWWTWSRIALGATAIGSALLINGSTLHREFPIPSAVIPYLFFGLAVAWCTHETEAQESTSPREDDAP